MSCLNKMVKLTCKNCGTLKFNIFINPKEITFVCTKCGKQGYYKFDKVLEEK